MVSYLVLFETLLQNGTDVIIKCDRYFIPKCNKSLLQNTTLITKCVGTKFMITRSGYIRKDKTFWVVTHDCNPDLRNQCRSIICIICAPEPYLICVMLIKFAIQQQTVCDVCGSSWSILWLNSNRWIHFLQKFYIYLCLFFDCYCRSLISRRDTWRGPMPPPRFEIFLISPYFLRS